MTEISPDNEMPFMKKFYKVVNSIICRAKEARTSIALNID